MRFSGTLNMSAPIDTEVDGLLMSSSCWSNGSSQQSTATTPAPNTSGSSHLHSLHSLHSLHHHHHHHHLHPHHGDPYLLDSASAHKLMLDEQDLDSLASDSDVQRGSMDVLDNLIMNSASLSSSLAELKPLPPFTGYTGHLSINGISGHHYHAIAQRMPEENNNSYGTLSHNPFQSGSGGGNSTPSSTPNSHNAEQNIVSSSTTCLPDSVLNPDTSDSVNNNHNNMNNNNTNVNSGNNSNMNNNNNNTMSSSAKMFADVMDVKIYSLADSCIMSSPHNSSNNNNNNTSNNNGPDSLSSVRIYSDAKELSDLVDMSSIDDIAAIIGSAIADTTVPNHLDNGDGPDSRDSWMDLDAWIDGNCSTGSDGKMIISQQDTINEFILPHSPLHSSATSTVATTAAAVAAAAAAAASVAGGLSTTTLQSLLGAPGYMPLLQNRLQNGPPIKLEAPSSSTSAYCNDLISTSSSPPGSVVSTTDNLLLNNSGGGSRYNPHLQHHHSNHSNHHNNNNNNIINNNNNNNNNNNITNNNNGNNNNTHQTYQLNMSSGGLKADGLCSPDLIGNYPHTTSATPMNSATSSSSSSTTSSTSSTSTAAATALAAAAAAAAAVQKNKRRAQKKQQQHQHQQQQQQSHSLAHQSTQMTLAAATAQQVNFQGAGDLSGLLGKEKPVHRCNICNRGFLNKSNIKVHLRTHTGEKPFRCEVCSKAFRQKAHLIKHQQIHKRIGRD